MWVYLFDIVAIEAERHPSSRAGDGIVSLRRDIPDQIPVEIRGKKIAEEDMRVGGGGIIGGLDAGNRVVDKFVRQVGRRGFRNCRHRDTSNAALFTSSHQTMMRADGQHKSPCATLAQEGELAAEPAAWWQKIGGI